jgi:hypothetical protein
VSQLVNPEHNDLLAKRDPATLCSLLDPAPMVGSRLWPRALRSGWRPGRVSISRGGPEAVIFSLSHVRDERYTLIRLGMDLGMLYASQVSLYGCYCPRTLEQSRLLGGWLGL